IIRVLFGDPLTSRGRTSIAESIARLLASPRPIGRHFRPVSATGRGAVSPPMPPGPIVEPENATIARARPDEVEITLGEELRDRFRDGQQILFGGVAVIDAPELQAGSGVGNETAVTGG